MIIFRFIIATGPNQKYHQVFMKKTQKKSVKPTKNPTVFFSFEKCTVK